MFLLVVPDHRPVKRLCVCVCVCVCVRACVRACMRACVRACVLSSCVDHHHFISRGDTEEASCKQHVPVMVYCHFDLLACRF